MESRSFHTNKPWLHKNKSETLSGPQKGRIKGIEYNAWISLTPKDSQGTIKTIQHRKKKKNHGTSEEDKVVVSYVRGSLIKSLKEWLKTNSRSVSKVRDEYKYSLLHIAARVGNRKILEILLNQKDIDVNDHHPITLETPLHLAWDQVTALYLISRNANVNAVDKFLETPMHKASRRGHTSLVEFFLRHGSNPNAINKRGVKPVGVTTTRQILQLRAPEIKRTSNFDEGVVQATFTNCNFQFPSLKMMARAAVWGSNFGEWNKEWQTNLPVDLIEYLQKSKGHVCFGCGKMTCPIVSFNAVFDVRFHIGNENVKFVTINVQKYLCSMPCVNKFWINFYNDASLRVQVTFRNVPFLENSHFQM